MTDLETTRRDHLVARRAQIDAALVAQRFKIELTLMAADAYRKAAEHARAGDEKGMLQARTQGQGYEDRAETANHIYEELRQPSWPPYSA